MNRYAPPTTEVSDPDQTPIEANPEKLAEANISLKRARLAFVAFFACYFLIRYTAENYSSLLSLVLLAMLLFLVAAHIFLGQSAKRAGKSVVLYALLPVVVPILGGLISFGVLWSKIDKRHA